MNQVRQNIQTRLQFLSFVYSTLGSPRDFEITVNHVEILWSALTQFNDLKVTKQTSDLQPNLSPNTEEYMISIKDDLFNWILNQARSKDQHAISVEVFKQIFVNKMPLLDPNSFSQNALHLYQELFKIYKGSFQQQQSTNTHEANLENLKIMEKSAIDYIGKLAFKSANSDVSLAAIQFLNSHFTQSDTISNVEQENQFIDSCMSYLNEARANLENEQGKLEFTFEVVQRGLLLLRTHLDMFQRRHSFQLRLMQLNSEHDSLNDSLFFFSHLKILQQMSSDNITKLFRLNAFNLNSLFNLNSTFSPFTSLLKESGQATQNLFITFVCNINPTQFKFNLTLSLNDCVGDLKAMIREIVLKTIKSSQIENEPEENISSENFFILVKVS